MTTGGANLSFEVDTRVIETIPQDARFELSVVDDFGASAEVTRTLAEPEGSGITWGTVVALIAAALFAGGFVGNMFASKRRQPARGSVYDAVQRRLESERAGKRARRELPEGSTDVYRLLAEDIDKNGARPDGDVWERIVHLVDPTELRPKLADDIEIRVFEQRWGDGYVMIANPADLLHYRLAASDLGLLQMMDGTRTVKEIVIERFEGSGEMELSTVIDLVRSLYRGQLPRTALRRRSEHGDPCHGSGDRTTPQGPGVR